MYFVEKNNTNKYVFFVIRNNKFKIVDYFLICPSNYYNIFEDYIFDLFATILENNFKDKRYNKTRMRKLLEVYKIDIKDEFKISFKETYGFKEILDYLHRYLVSYKSILKSKETFEGIKVFLNSTKERFEHLLLRDNKVCNDFFDFFKRYKKAELIDQIFNLYFVEEYEIAISNALKFEHDYNDLIKKNKEILANIKYYS